MIKMMILALALTGATQAQSSNIQLPEGVSCNDVFWNSPQYVKGKLSLKEECWLAKHRADEKSGSLGDKLWIKIEGKYFSASKARLRASFSDEDKATEALTQEFIRQHKEWKRNGNN